MLRDWPVSSGNSNSNSVVDFLQPHTAAAGSRRIPMSWFRKVLLSTLATLALATPAGFLGKAEAAPPLVRTQVQARYYWVYYRGCCHDSWHLYGSYRKYHHAYLAAIWLRYYGYEAYIY
jgi:hypothetical protein